ncbi:MAG: hypothetical protein NTZ10_02735 [Candidatus Saganbacteria bacterium]|nr:hypothetical protein [Candidatus Saganbacteria bacterium]
MPKYRIGIDVGGTFTHAVAIDNSNYELAGQAKLPTTHNAERGVAQGIIDSLNKLLCDSNISPADIVFIAHSTTQATNALLEGDVAAVGIIAVGKGVEGKRVRAETNIGDIDLDNGKRLKVLSRYIELKGEKIEAETVDGIIKDLVKDGVQVIVAAEAFSVDDPVNEDFIVRCAIEKGLPAAATHQISGLYGLRMRTRTAAVNASIMPKMIEAAVATQDCVRQSGITAPLMIMRSDGGVMSIDEMKKRPILTILSGPAAGVASALLYVKISDGIFLEVGGTSTDISVIRNGRALVKSAEIGGHRLYLRTIDSRTVGAAGGSMPRICNGKIVDVGPRSAHIAGLKYASFSNVDEIVGAHSRAPLQDGYFSIGGKYAVTTTCAANVLGLVRKEDWAYGNRDAAEEGIRILSKKISSSQAVSPQQLSKSILKTASAKIIKTIDSLIKDYKLEKENVTLIGGGGGAAAIVPFTASELKMEYKIADNHAVLSAIGAALAFVTDTIEKSAVDPSREDILKIRQEAEESVRRMGADPNSIEVSVEVDLQKNVIRAVASGATELRKKDLQLKKINEEEKAGILCSSFKAAKNDIKLLGSTDWFEVWGAKKERRSFFGLIKNTDNSVRVIDKQGIIRIQRRNAIVIEVAAGFKPAAAIEQLLEKHTVYGDAGEKTPPLTVLKGSRIIDLSGLVSKEQVTGLFGLEMKNASHDEKIVIILDH